MFFGTVLPIKSGEINLFVILAVTGGMCIATVAKLVQHFSLLWVFIVKYLKYVTAHFQILALLALAACSDTSSQSGVTNVDLSFSDAAVENASEVVVTVESITFRRNSDDESGDIVVETFASSEDGQEAETFTLDLLTVQGEDRRLVVDSVELPVGDYSNMLIQVVDDSENGNYVVDAEGTKPLKVPSNVLKLGGFTIEPTSKQSMVVEFGLQQSMTYNPGPDRYILKPRGVRIISVDQAALVTGTINHTTLQANSSCTALDLGGTAGSVYLYPGHGIALGDFGDNFDAELLSNNDNLKVAPITSASLKNGAFSLSYLEAGDYTLAVSCHDEPDDADQLEELTIPNPEDQIAEFTIAVGQTVECPVPLTEDGCTQAVADTNEEVNN